MKYITVKKKEINLKEFVKRRALDSDYSTLITEDTTILDETGKVLIVYKELKELPLDFVQALIRVKYTVGKRTQGLVSTSRIFGWRPRNEVRQNFCSATSLAKEQPSEHSIIAGFAPTMETLYRETAPDVFARHKETTDSQIKPEYKLNGTVFTSGIANKNNPLKYHFDTGNFKDVFSAMIVFKGGTTNGHLSCPEYDLGFELKNNSVLLFDGQSILHGVTPIKRESEKSYRFSVVYYSLKNIWNCLVITEEIARARKIKTEKEYKRLDPEHLATLGKRKGKQ